jgi:hypothetical protein
VATRVALEALAHGPWIDQLEPLRFLQRPPEWAHGNKLAEVEQRAGWRGHGNAAPGEYVFWVERADAVERDIGPRSSASRPRNVDRRHGRRVYAEQRPGAPMAEQRPRATREDRRHPAAEPSYRRMPHREDASMDRVQPTRRDPDLDRAPPDAEFAQLAPRHDAVLALRQPGDRPVIRTCARFAPYSVGNIAHVRILSLSGARIARRRGASRSRW